VPSARTFAVPRIVAVVTKVEHHHFVALAQRSPERKVAVDGQTIAMT